jgi:hypothetical protein
MVNIIDFVCYLLILAIMITNSNGKSTAYEVDDDTDAAELKYSRRESADAVLGITKRCHSKFSGYVLTNSDASAKGSGYGRACVLLFGARHCCDGDIRCGGPGSGYSSGKCYCRSMKNGGIPLSVDRVRNPTNGRPDTHTNPGGYTSRNGAYGVCY